MRHPAGIMLIISSLLPAQALLAAPPAPQAPEAIIAPAGASRLTDLAARELQRYLYAASGTLLPIIANADAPAFVLGGPDENPLVRELVNSGTVKLDAAALGDQGYILRTLKHHGHMLTIAAGVRPIGTLYAVYDLLERYGFGFYLGGDAVPSPQPLSFLHLREARKPALGIRGSLPWYNFLDSPTTWNLADHKRFYDQMAKMRMNFVGFHAYDYEPFAAVKIAGQYQYGQALQNTAQGVWGTIPMKTAEFGFGTGDCFAREFFGADPSFDYKTQAESIERSQRLLADGLAYARERGMHVCVGFEVNGDPSDPNNERDLEARLKHLVEQYPMVEYVWIWQSEGRGGGGEQSVPRADTLFGNYDRQVRAQFAYLGDPARIAEAARVSYYTHLAHAILRKQAPQMRLIVSGWGGDQWMRFSDFYVGLDKTLPPDVIFSALDNIDPSASAQVSHAYGELSPGRQRWPIPWFESDGGGTRRDQWSPACNVKPFTALCRDALAKGAQGLLGIHWRTRGVEEVAAYVAQFGWNPDLTYEGFYRGVAQRRFGPAHAAETSQILQDLEALGPRYTGARGQVECGGFTWFSDGERPKPENLAKLARIESRLTALKAEADPRHVAAFDTVLSTIRWVTKFDLAAFKLQPGGEVETAVAGAEAAKATNSPDAGAKAQAALAITRGTGLNSAFQELTRVLITQGDMGVLATANGKAWAFYRDFERRLERIMGPLPADRPDFTGLELAATVTPDRLDAGQPLAVRVIARTDNGPAVVGLRWRKIGAGGWKLIPAPVEARCTYLATLPAGKLAAPGVEYYFEAVDLGGRKATWPAGGPDNPASTVVLAPRSHVRWAAPAPSADATGAATDLKAANAGPYQVALSWQAPAQGAVRGWEVWRAAGSERKQIARTRLPSWLDQLARPSTTYVYTVRPVGWGGKSGAALSATVTTPTYPPPTKPGPVSAVPAVRAARLAWPTTEAAVDAFRITRRQAGQPEKTITIAGVDALVGNEYVYCAEDLPADADLEYQIVAMAPGGAESPASDPVKVRPRAPSSRSR